MPKVVHFEILGNNPEELNKFYSKVFEWEIDTNNPIGYGMVKSSGKGSIGGGIGKVEGGLPPHAIFYIEVDDVQTYLDKLSEMGGQVLVPKTEIPNMVIFALFQDPEGNKVGLVQSE